MLTMEVILSTAFGRAIDVQGGNGGKLYEAAVKAFSDFSPDSQKKQMSATRMIQFLLRKPICVFPNYVSIIEYVCDSGVMFCFLRDTPILLL